MWSHSLHAFSIIDLCVLLFFVDHLSLVLGQQLLPPPARERILIYLLRLEIEHRRRTGTDRLITQLGRRSWHFDLQVVGQSHEAHGKLGAYVFVALLLTQVLQALFKVLLKLVQTALQLGLLLSEYFWISQVTNPHREHLLEHLHVLLQLQAHQVRQREECLVILLRHEVSCSFGF